MTYSPLAFVVGNALSSPRTRPWTRALFFDHLGAHGSPSDGICMRIVNAPTWSAASQHPRGITARLSPSDDWVLASCALAPEVYRLSSMQGALSYIYGSLPIPMTLETQLMHFGAAG